MGGTNDDVCGGTEPCAKLESSVKRGSDAVGVTSAIGGGAFVVVNAPFPQSAPAFDPAFVQGHLKRTKAVALQSNIGRRKAQRLGRQHQGSPEVLNPLELTALALQALPLNQSQDPPQDSD